MGNARSNAEYISFAATLGTATAPLPTIRTVRCGTFIKQNPEVVVAWHKFGMTAKAIAQQLTLVGMPISGSTLKEYLPNLKVSADATLVDAIVAQLRLTFMAARCALADKAEQNHLSTLTTGTHTSSGAALRAAEAKSQFPSHDSIPSKTEPKTHQEYAQPAEVRRQATNAPVVNGTALPATPAHSMNTLEKVDLLASALARVADRSTASVPSPITTAKDMEAIFGTSPPNLTIANGPRAASANEILTPEEEAIRRSPFYVPPVLELIALPGEEDDLSNTLSHRAKPCSFGAFRRAAWKTYKSRPMTYEITMPCGKVLMPPKKLLTPLVRGDYLNWEHYLKAVAKG